MTQVKDIMVKEAVCVEPNASLWQAASLMRENDIGDVFVTEGAELRGIITDRDITVRAVAAQADLNLPVESFISDDVVALEPEHDIEDAIVLMRKKAVRRLPVVNDGSVVGVVSLGDLALIKDPSSALADISRAPSNSKE